MSRSARVRHWAEIDEVTFVAGIRFLLLAYRTFGRSLFRALLYPTVVFYIATNARARAASRGYLTRMIRAGALPDASVGPRLLIRHFSSFAECIFDKVRIWNDPSEPVPVEFHDRQVVADQIALGRGGIIVMSHLGNIELCRVLAKQRAGLRLTVLVHTKHAVAFNRLLAELNPESGLDLWQVTDLSPEAAMRIGEKIDRGEFVVMAGDRIPISPAPRVAFAEFLGDRAAFPVGPYILASALQCPLYLLFCLRRGDEYHVHYEMFRDRIDLPRKERVPVLNGLVAEYAKRLEHYCRIAPLEWCNFFDFWAESGAGWNHG